MWRTDAAGGKAGFAIQAMHLEAELRTNPALRADKFVEPCQSSMRRRPSLTSKGIRLHRIRDTQGAMATSLERDPQVESVLATRKQALGLVYDRDPSVGKSLAKRGQRTF